MICCVACDRRSSWLRHRRSKEKGGQTARHLQARPIGAGRSLSHTMKSVGGGLPPRARSFAVHCARWPWLCRQTCIRACATEKDRAGINGVITSRSRSGLAMDHGLWLRDRQHASRGNSGPVVQLGVSKLARDPANCSGRLIWCWRGSRDQCRLAHCMANLDPVACALSARSSNHRHSALRSALRALFRKSQIAYRRRKFLGVTTSPDSRCRNLLNFK